MWPFKSKLKSKLVTWRIPDEYAEEFCRKVDYLDANRTKLARYYLWKFITRILIESKITNEWKLAGFKNSNLHIGWDNYHPQLEVTLYPHETNDKKTT